ncbi:MAG: hypothetical protein ACP5UA_13490 [Candidatus Hydrogenedens sp.]
MKKYLSNLIAFLLGCAFLIGILFISEMISRPIYNRYFKLTIQENPSILTHTDITKPKKLNAGIKGYAVIKKGSLPSVTYNYSIDKKGRRNTYSSSETEKKVNYLFIGCSFTFGTEVNDNETLPSQFAMRNPHCKVYNYGVPGYSPQEIYLSTLNSDFTDDIKALPTVVVYTFIGSHLKRLIGSWSIIGRWGKYLPHIEMGKGEILNLGTFADTKPYSCFISEMLYKSTLISMIFDIKGIDYPPEFTKDQFELLYLLLLKTRENLSKRFPEIQMVFLFFPGSAEAVPGIYDYIKGKKEFIVIDYFRDSSKKEILNGLEKKNEHKYPDGHPKPIIYSYLAEWLTEDLKTMNLTP